MNLINKQKTFFSSDLHLNHQNIIKYCNRPFSGVKEMEECILENFNAVIKKSDRLYLLGDISWTHYNWEDFFSKLNCSQIHVIWGNHDDEAKRVKTPGVCSFAHLRNLKMPGKSVVLCHYAMRSWQGKARGAYHLWGHSHGTLPNFGRSMDVGIDPLNFKPIEWEEVIALLEPIDPGSE